jgi:hypothetical protein
VKNRAEEHIEKAIVELAQRTGEIGLRLALGASEGKVLRLIAWEGLRMALGGIGLGYSEQ